jgi:hypothetical protein
MLFDANLAIFGYDKTFCQVAELNRLMKSTKTFAEFKPLAEKYLQKTHIQYLQTEYNYALAKSQSGAMWVKMIREEEQFPVAILRTMLDQAVRNSHKALEGREFLLKEREQWKNLMTPLGPGCRCYMEQGIALNPDKKADANTIINTIGDEAHTKLKNGGWLYNGGDLGEIFSHNRMYSEQLGIKPKAIFKITASESEIISYSKLNQNTFTPLTIDLNTTANDARKLFKSKQNEDTQNVNYLDFRGRPISLTKRTFEKHISGDYIKEKRPAFFQLIDETLKNPDEVFIYEHTSGNYQIRYLKFYQNRVITVPVTLNSKGMQIKTWFEASGIDAGLNFNIDAQVRNGLPIKRMELRQ